MYCMELGYPNSIHDSTVVLLCTRCQCSPPPPPRRAAAPSLAITLGVVEEASRLGIKRLWLQPGSENDEVRGGGRVRGDANSPTVTSSINRGQMFQIAERPVDRSQPGCLHPSLLWIQAVTVVPGGEEAAW